MKEKFGTAQLPDLSYVDSTAADGLLKRLGLGSISSYFDFCCAQAKQDTQVPFWLTETYVRQTAADISCLNVNLEAVVSAIKPVVQNKDLLLFAKTLYRMLSVRRRHEIVFENLAFPRVPAGADPLPYDLFSIFPLLSRVRDAYGELRGKGVDETILVNTAKDIDECITRATKIVGRPAFTVGYFRWCTAHSNGALFRIKRLNFELRDYCPFGVRAFANTAGEIKILMLDGVPVHRSGLLLGSAGAEEEEGSFMTAYTQTDTYYEGYSVDQSTAGVETSLTRLEKSEWTPIFGPEDIAMNIHIPRDEPFTPELVRDSLNEGIDVIQKLYPELDLKVFLCTSWLLAPELKRLLKPQSNIMNFQNRFTKFPIEARGLTSFSFVFGRDTAAIGDVEFDTLPESTSLQRNIKAFYCSGNVIHETGGLILLSRQEF